jgi:hypothetical protein
LLSFVVRLALERLPGAEVGCDRDGSDHLDGPNRALDSIVEPRTAA